MRSRLSSSMAIFLILGWIIAVPGSAFAQGNTWPGANLAQLVDEAQWRFDLLRLNAAFLLSNTGYDTDIFFGYYDQPAPDMTMTAAVPVQLLIPISKKAVFELNDTPQYLFYGRNDRERAWNNQFNGRFHLGLDRVYIQVSGGASNIRQRMGPELDLNIRGKDAIFDGTFLWQASARVSIAALVSNTQYRYGQAAVTGYDLATTLNRKESFADLIIYSDLGTKARIYLNNQFGRIVFKNPASRGRDTRSYGIFAGLTFLTAEEYDRPIAPPQGHISLGFKYFDVFNPAVADGSNLVGACDFTIGIFSKTTAKAFLLRDYAFSVYSDGTFYLSTALGGGLSRRLSRRITFSYDASLSLSDYPDLEGGASQQERKYHISNHMLSMNIRISRKLAISILAQFSRRSLGELASHHNRSLFGLNLVVGAPPSSIASPVRGLNN